MGRADGGAGGGVPVARDVGENLALAAHDQFHRCAYAFDAARADAHQAVRMVRMIGNGVHAHPLPIQGMGGQSGVQYFYKTQGLTTGFSIVLSHGAWARPPEGSGWPESAGRTAEGGNPSGRVICTNQECGPSAAAGAE